MKTIIRTEADRTRVMEIVKRLQLDPPSIVEIKELRDTRSIRQNNKLWAMLADISNQVDWYGRRMKPEEWKHFFSASLKGQTAVPNMDGTGFIIIGMPTSKMTIKEMVDMVDLMYSFCSDKNVRWSDPSDIANSERDER